MRALLALAVLIVASASTAFAEDTALDQKVRRFLEKNRGEWRDMNVPWVDGQILHDLVVKNRFRRALEIGTSTGHSSVWIAWALSTDRREARHDRDRPLAPRRGSPQLRGGGRRRPRRRPARRRPRAREAAAGAVRLRLLRRRQGLVPAVLQGRRPEARGRGLLHRAQRAAQRRRRRRAFLDYVKKLPSYRTTVETGSGEGISVSCKTRR